MSYQVWAPQMGCKYVLTGASGSRAVFNDPTDADYVGVVTDLVGLDGAEVRESADDLVEADGGSHGNFYYGRRPIVISVKVYGHNSEFERETKIDKARRAFKECLRGDGTLWWQNNPIASYPAMTTWVRSQQKFVETGNWVKDLQLPLVSQYAPVFSASQNSSALGAGPFSLENKGDYPAFPIIEITGASTNPQVTVTVGGGTNRVFKTTGLTLAIGEKVQFDMLNHTGIFTAGARNGQVANRYIDFTGTTLWPYIDGATTRSLSLSGGGTFQVFWRDAWS